MEEIRLNKNQALKFAQTILPDIEMYVENHLEEFEEFLRNEEVLEVKRHDEVEQVFSRNQI